MWIRNVRQGGITAYMSNNMIVLTNVLEDMSMCPISGRRPIAKIIYCVITIIRTIDELRYG